MKNKPLIIVFILTCSIALLTGCSKKSSPAYEWAASDAAPRASVVSSSEMFVEQDEERFTENAPDIQEMSRKFTTSSNLRIRMENLDKGVETLNEIIVRYNTYASQVTVYENSRNYTLKVPAQNYKTFLEDLMKMGKIINYDETTEDVTLRYYDLESRLNTKKELIKTFQGYLGKAKNIEEILSVEKRLAELQAEIDDTGRQFKMLSNMIDYSTVRLELLGPVTVTAYGKETIGEKIKNLMNNFGDFMSVMAVTLLAIVVYGIPSIAILLLLYWVLFGKIGVLKKVFRLVSGNGNKEDKK